MIPRATLLFQINLYDSLSLRWKVYLDDMKNGTILTLYKGSFWSNFDHHFKEKFSVSLILKYWFKRYIVNKFRTIIHIEGYNLNAQIFISPKGQFWSKTDYFYYVVKDKSLVLLSYYLYYFHLIANIDILCHLLIFII